MTITDEPTEPAQAADDGAVLAVEPVAGERREILDQRLGIVLEMRPVGVARDLGLLPGGELGVGLRQQLGGAALEPDDLVGDVELAAVGEQAQLLDLALELEDRLFEVEERGHPMVTR